MRLLATSRTGHAGSRRLHNTERSVRCVVTKLMVVEGLTAWTVVQHRDPRSHMRRNAFPDA
jgi:hypothetical protein